MTHARFDICWLDDRDDLLAVIVQTDELSHLKTRIVVPLRRRSEVGREELPRLRPVIEVEGEPWVLSPLEIAAVPTSALSRPLVNAEVSHRTAITEALDVVFQGF